MISIREMLARAAGTGHSNQHNAWGSTSFWMCKVRCWRWLFGNQIPISLHPTAIRRGQGSERTYLTQCIY